MRPIPVIHAHASVKKRRSHEMHYVNARKVKRFAHPTERVGTAVYYIHIIYVDLSTRPHTRGVH